MTRRSAWAVGRVAQIARMARLSRRSSDGVRECRVVQVRVSRRGTAPLLWSSSRAGRGAAVAHGQDSPATGVGAQRELRGVVNEAQPPGGAAVVKRPAATYSPRLLRAKYHRRCRA